MIYMPDISVFRNDPFVLPEAVYHHTISRLRFVESTRETQTIPNKESSEPMRIINKLATFFQQTYSDQVYARVYLSIRNKII